MHSHSVGFGTASLTRFGNAIGYAKFFSRSHHAVFDEAGNVIETHEHTGDFKEP